MCLVEDSKAIENPQAIKEVSIFINSIKIVERYQLHSKACCFGAASWMGLVL